MNRNQKTTNIVLAGLLIAIAIVIPMFSPIRIVLEPASFTLASHVAIFIAMFLSPGIAAAVSLGSALGFLMGGFPLVIVARAASHVVFAVTGAVILKKAPALFGSLGKMTVLALAVSIIHGVCEVLATLPFYFAGNMPQVAYTKGFLESVLLLVGVGTVVHSMVDFAIAYVIWKAVVKTRA